MQIDIRSRGFTRSRTLCAYAQRRLRFALAKAGDQVSRVVVRLTDMTGQANDRRGEMGKCCRIHLILEGAPAILVEDIETDICRAIDRAASRAGRIVLRRMARHGVFPDGSRDHHGSGQAAHGL
ncbi:MAG: HPF/RaiA family ribosome-associated protein [Betaproteobacteria bacterium]|nr:HPF/RaiA family ribosome-associated protein [Betaproteobacteria bacterium]